MVMSGLGYVCLASRLNPQHGPSTKHRQKSIGWASLPVTLLPDSLTQGACQTHLDTGKTNFGLHKKCCPLCGTAFGKVKYSMG